MESRKILPIGRQTFQLLIEDEALYVDKTQYVYNLISKGSFYFLSRPRRFGKSLLLTTIEALFRGQKELFQGLWIEQQTDYAFDEHPVILLDMSIHGIKNREELEESIMDNLHPVRLFFRSIYILNNQKKPIYYKFH